MGVQDGTDEGNWFPAGLELDSGHTECQERRQTHLPGTLGLAG